MSMIMKPKEAYLAIGFFALIEQVIIDIKAYKTDDDPGIQWDEICLMLAHAGKSFITGTIMTWESVDPDHAPIIEPEAGNNDMPVIMTQIAVLELLGVKFPDIVKDKLNNASKIWNTIPRAEQIHLIDYVFDSVEGLFLTRPLIMEALKKARFALGVPDDDSSLGT